MRQLLLHAMVVVSCAPAVLAQSPLKEDYPRLEAFAGYSVIGAANNGFLPTFGPLTERASLSSSTGFETSTIGNLNRWFGFKGDFSGFFASDRDQAQIRVFCPDCRTAPASIHFKTRLFESMGGPEVKARNKTRWTPFAHTLFGVAHATATFKATGELVNFSEKTSDDAFAMAMGGGVDFRVANRLSLRGSVDYNPMFFGPSDTVANHRLDSVRVSIGVLFH